MEEIGGGERRKRRVKLVCPSVSVSKIVEFVAAEDQRLDLGSISRAFGLEPNSLKLNGHFISRGLDLIACSITWRSLLSFFSSRGFSTGAFDSDAIIVDGKLCKLGSKRKPDTPCRGNASVIEQHGGVIDSNENPLLLHDDLTGSKRFKDCRKGLLSKIDQTTRSNFLSLKRKLLSGDANPLKRTRVNDTNTGLPEKNDDQSKKILNGQFSCSIFNENAKRMREDDLLVAAPCKRIR